MKPTTYRPNQTPSLLALIISSNDNSLVNSDYLSPIGQVDLAALKIDLQISFKPYMRTVSIRKTYIDFKALGHNLNELDWDSTYIVQAGSQ